MAKDADSSGTVTFDDWRQLTGYDPQTRRYGKGTVRHPDAVPGVRPGIHRGTSGRKVA